jgi:glycosyltransferase involved in cell wall biosynthesis
MKGTITIVGGHILGGVSGGPTTHISELSQLLTEKYQVNVISPSKSSKRELIRNGKLTVYLEPKGPLMPLHVLNRFFKLISNSDIIHFHSAKTALLGLFIRKKPIVLTLHGYYSKESVKYSLKFLNSIYSEILKFIEYISIRRADIIIVVGKGIGKYVIDQFDVNPQKLVYIPNGIDVDKINNLCNDYFESSMSLKSRLGLEDKKIILFIKSFTAYNGIIELIKSMPTILKSHPDAHLVAIGGGPIKSEIIRLCKELEVEPNITLLDQIAHDSVPMYLNIANVFVVPFIPPYISSSQVAGVGDTLGIVHLEAMAAKVPVIGTAIGNISELEKEMKGAIKYVPPEDYLSLAKMINYLLNSPELCNHLGHLGYDVVAQDYDIHKICKEISSVYDSLIASEVP